MGTQFSEIYNRFLAKITDDMYMELTPEDTIKDLRQLLTDAIPGFEFPRHNLANYTIQTLVIEESEITEDDFVIGTVWEDLEESSDQPVKVYVERSSFDVDLTSEEENILALLMMCAWVQRQLTSIENTRMKYTGTDFKMTSQANHMAKLKELLTECHRQELHMQRLYKRRKSDDDGNISSNWSVFGKGVYYQVDDDDE